MISLSLSLAAFSDYVDEQSNLLEVRKIELMFISGLKGSLYEYILIRKVFSRRRRKNRL